MLEQRAVGAPVGAAGAVALDEHRVLAAAAAGHVDGVAGEAGVDVGLGAAALLLELLIVGLCLESGFWTYASF